MGKFGYYAASFGESFKCIGSFSQGVQDYPASVGIVASDEIHDGFEVLTGREGPKNFKGLVFCHDRLLIF